MDEQGIIVSFRDFYMYPIKRKFIYNSFIVLSNKYTLISYFKELCRSRLKEISPDDLEELQELASRMGLKKSSVNIKGLQEFSFDRIISSDKTLNFAKSEGTWAYKELLGTQDKKFARKYLAAEALKLLKYFNRRDKAYKGILLYITDSAEVFQAIADKISIMVNQETILIDTRYASDDFIFDEINKRSRLFQFTRLQQKKISEVLNFKIDLLKDLCDALSIVSLDKLAVVESTRDYSSTQYTIKNIDLDEIIDELYLGNYYNFLDHLLLKEIASSKFKAGSKDFKTFSKFQDAFGADKLASDLLYRLELFIEIKLLLIQGKISYQVKTQNYRCFLDEDVRKVSRLVRIHYKRRIIYIDACQDVSLNQLLELKNKIQQQRDSFRFGKIYAPKLEQLFLKGAVVDEVQ